MRHTVTDARYLLHFLRKTVAPNASLIGSLAKGKASNHDIDILIPGGGHKLGKRRTLVLILEIERLLEAKCYSFTDWGGVFFEGTVFGNVDIFFEKPE